MEERESKERTFCREKPTPGAAASPLPLSCPANAELRAPKGSAGSPASLGDPNRPPLARDAAVLLQMGL